MPDQHALLSPSAAHRWMQCPAAPRLEAMMPDVSSAFAEEGSLAHAYCARKLKIHIGEETTGEDAEIAALNASYYAPEMEAHTDEYVDHVLECLAQLRSHDRHAHLMVERRLSFGDYVPESFGTSDAIAIGAGELHVFDFKYGKGVEVSAEENPQMMIYALGALLACDDGSITSITMHIEQPRLRNYSEWTMTRGELLAWASRTLRPVAEKASRGEGGQHAGEWCRFCKVKAQCRELARYCTEESSCGLTRTPQGLLSADDIALNVLPRLATIRQWVEAVEKYALDSALNGVSFPGYKLVEGVSRSRISDTGAVADALARHGFADADIFKPRELLSLTDLKKKTGTAVYNDCVAPYIYRPKGAPKLVENSAHGRPFFSIHDDFESMTDNQ